VFEQNLVHPLEVIIAKDEAIISEASKRIILSRLKPRGAFCSFLPGPSKFKIYHRNIKKYIETVLNFKMTQKNIVKLSLFLY
jgi:hypothetical protein